MATVVPAKKNTAYTFYVGLVSQANSLILQANPTLAAGDVKVAVDDAAPANVTDLPVVDADFTKRVKVTLTAAEMNGDNITVLFSDAAGDEWCDLAVNIQTVAAQIDDIKAETANILTDTAVIGAAGAGLTALGDARLANLDAAVSTRSTLTAQQVWEYATRTLSSFGTLVADIATAVWGAGARTLTSFGTLVADAAAAVWAAVARTLTAGTKDAEIDAIKAKTDNLPTDPADESLLIAATDAIMTRLGAPAGASIAADLLTIDNLVDDLEGRLTAARAGYLDELGAANLPTDIDNLLARLTALRAGYLDNLSAGAAALEANVQTHAAAALGAYDPPTKAELDAALAALNDITVAEVLAGVVEGTLSLTAVLRLMLAALAGKAAGGGTATITFRDLADSKPRITATVDADGNRTAVAVDGA